MITRKGDLHFQATPGGCHQAYSRQFKPGRIRNPPYICRKFAQAISETDMANCGDPRLIQSAIHAFRMHIPGSIASDSRARTSDKG